MTPTSAAPTTGAVRLVRAAALGATALALAVVAHVAAGGSAPGPLGLATLALATAAPALVLTTVRLRPLAILATLGALELGLHTGLTLLTAGGGAAVVSTGHHHAVIAAGTSAGHAGHGITMTLAHLVATVVTALLLARGEELLWLAAAVVAPGIGLLLHLGRIVARSTCPRPAVVHAPSPLATRHWAIATPRRGPPALG